MKQDDERNNKCKCLKKKTLIFDNIEFITNEFNLHGPSKLYWKKFLHDFIDMTYFPSVLISLAAKPYGRKSLQCNN